MVHLVVKLDEGSGSCRVTGVEERTSEVHWVRPSPVNWTDTSEPRPRGFLSGSVITSLCEPAPVAAILLSEINFSLQLEESVNSGRSLG